MNSRYTLTGETMLSTLPSVLRQDADMLDLATATANSLEKLISKTDVPKIYPRIDELDEPVLDILAWDFKVDWWDYSFTLFEKRNTLKRSWYVHKHMGTPSAVKTALSAIYPDTKMEEWFQYGGRPYHFRLKIPVDTATLDLEKHEKVLSLVSFYKNLRSVLDSIEYSGSTQTVTFWPMAAQFGIHLIESGSAKESGTVGNALLDELNEILLDELGNILTDE